MLEQKSRIIGGANYRVGQIPATKCYKLAIAVGKIVGPALGHLLDAQGIEGFGDVELKSDTFSDAVSALLSRADENEVERIISQLAEVTMVDPAGGEAFQPLKGIFELHFAGKLKAMSLWLKFALETQFADFLG